MDHVVRSNLNRCLFFSDADARHRQLKAEVVAAQLTHLKPEVQVTPYLERIEKLSDTFIPSHDIVLGCLDNLEARLYVNTVCYRGRVPYVDGATRGLVGKVQVVVPPTTRPQTKRRQSSKWMMLMLLS
jgi:molybdopterin/thiamine biosynthesis adenylyltransferase